MPNLALATELRIRHPHVRFRYIGSRLALDAALVKASGIPFHSIFAGKLRRYFSWRNFLDPFLVLTGFFQALLILIRFRPQAVFCKGGYVSVPVALAAFLMRRPVILHESDAVMGLANRISARFAQKICLSFPSDAYHGKKYVVTGNPVRSGLKEGQPQKGWQITGFKKGLPVILVWGGSLGAQQINEMIAGSFDGFVEHFQLIHITGKGKAPNLSHPNYRPFEYVGDELRHLYAITDLMVSRAGANSLAEIALLQKPAILIPLPNADQQANARVFEEAGASHVLKEGEGLLGTLFSLSRDPERQNQMRKALGTLSKPDAVEKVAQVIEKQVSK